MDLHKIAQDYILYQSQEDSLKDSALYESSVDVLFGLTRRNPEVAWKIIQMVVELTDDEWVLTMLGCEELEDILAFHFEQFIDRVEQESKKARNSRS